MLKKIFPFLSQTQRDDRDLLVSILSYLDPATKWSVRANHLTTFQLYYYLAESLKGLKLDQMREVLHLMPRALQEQLDMVITRTME